MEDLSEKTRCGNCQYGCYVDYFKRVCINTNSVRFKLRVEDNDYCTVWERQKVEGPRIIWRSRERLETVGVDIDVNGKPFIRKKHIVSKIPYCSECTKRLDGTFLKYCDNCGVKFEGEFVE